MIKLKKPLVIVANGDFPVHPKPINILNKAKSILACDGATDTLINNGYTPSAIIGDIDSISRQNKKTYNNKLIIEKDQHQNDLRKAINYAIKQNINNISIIGSSGKREDHTIGNIFSLFEYIKTNIKIYTDTGFFTCIHKPSKIKSFKGQQVSIFSQNYDTIITSNNLKYNFNKRNISNIFEGTLNESISDEFELKFSNGALLIFQVYK